MSSILVVLAGLLILAGCDAGTPAATPTATALPATATLPPTPTVAATATAVEPAATATLGPGQFRNPVIDQDFPDPDSLKVGNTYYAYATNTGNTNIQAAKSTDLVHWTMLRDALPVLPEWAQPNNTWAPEVTMTADSKGYVMYFAAQEMGSKYECIGVATSSAPDGRFRSPGKTPLICDEGEGGDIDPSSFVDDDGTRYILWKNDGNCCGAATWLQIQRVSADGLTLQGQRTKLIQNDQNWESLVIEAPTLWKHNGRYYLFYSANAYNSPSYAIGYAVADSILGPYHKPEGPLLQSHLQLPQIISPGGQDITVGPDGQTWLLFHSWDPTVSYRGLNVKPLAWNGDTPVVKDLDQNVERIP